VTRLAEIQVALPTDAALIAWVDTLPPVGPGAADPDGEHWGVVVRSKRTPTWIALAGSGDDGLWTDDDWALGSSLRTAITSEPPAPASEIDRLAMALRIQRLKPLESALAATDTLPQARRLIVLPSSALAGVPIDLLLEPDDNRVVSYAPSARVLTYLRKQPRSDASAGLLALGDPIFRRPDASTTPPPPPDYGLLVNMVVPGSNAARHDLLAGDVLLSYNGRKLQGREDLQLVGSGTRPVRVEIWRQGKLVRGAVDPGQLGIVIESRPATQAIAANREFDRLLVATRSRSGSEELEDLPGTRHEVGSLARMFRQVGRPVRELYGSDASEPNLDALAQAGELGRFAFLHLATHGRVDLDIPERSAVILTQTGLPDSVEQVLQGKNPYDGELSVREIQRSWQLNAELVTLSACQTALGKQAGGEGLMGFTQALLMSGARSVCLSLWKVDDQATSLLMRRFYENLLGMREGLKAPMPKAEALHEAKVWLRNLKAEEVEKQLRDLDKSAPGQTRSPPKKPQVKTAPKSAKPFEHPHYWASFILIGDPD
jgi:hypothetical protein